MTLDALTKVTAKKICIYGTFANSGCLVVGLVQAKLNFHSKVGLQVLSRLSRRRYEDGVNVDEGRSWLLCFTYWSPPPPRVEEEDTSQAAREVPFVLWQLIYSVPPPPPFDQISQCRSG